MIVDYEKRGDKGFVDKYILISQSPRRKDLLSFLNPLIIKVDIDEREVEAKAMAKFHNDDFLTRACKTCCEISKAKSKDLVEDDSLYISADTFIVHENRIYNKPKDREEALAMLTSYLGKKHLVVTSVCLRKKDYLDCFYSTTEIEFVEYYPQVLDILDSYLDNSKYLDKAGAYGIQDLDPRLVKEINGDIYTIIGMPVAEVAKRLAE